MGVHQSVAAGLHLGDPVVVQVVGAGATGGHHVAAHEQVGGHEGGHAGLELRGALAPRHHAHQVALVAHHAPHGQPGRAGVIGQAARLLGRAPAPPEADVHVDQHVAQPGRGRGGDGLGRVDGDRDAHAVPLHGVGQRAQASHVEHLVGHEQVVAHTGRGQAGRLPRGGAREGAVPVAHLLGRQRRALVRLHVRPQTGARARGRHGREVGLERVGVEDQGGRGQVGEAHGLRCSRPGRCRPRGWLSRPTTLFPR